MSCLPLILILTFILSTKSINTYYNSSNYYKHGNISYVTDANLTRKCYSCIDDLDGVRQDCSRKSQFITCKYSQDLINWEDINYKVIKGYGCIILIYKENGKQEVARGCVGLTDEDHEVCDSLSKSSKYKEISKCFMCTTDKCNISNSGLRKFKGNLLILSCVILTCYSYSNILKNKT